MEPMRGGRSGALVEISSNASAVLLVLLLLRVERGVVQAELVSMLLLLRWLTLSMSSMSEAASSTEPGEA